MKRTSITAAVAALLVSAVAACGGNGSDGQAQARGPIKIWYSNNQEEVAWGKQMVQAWNKQHADQKITAQEIPAGKSSEEVIGAAIAAGNAPCLIFNTAPAAVPQFQKQGGLVPLDEFDGAQAHIEERTGDRAAQYRSPDGKYYQLPWKANPVMIFYNKEIFAKAGLDADNPPLGTYDEFVATARKIVDSGAAERAIWPSPTAEFFQPWFDFYPLFAAETGGKQLVEDGKAQFTSDEGKAVTAFWKALYDGKLASQEAYNGDAFGDGKSAMAIVGPWAIASYKDKVDWGVAPVPTSEGTRGRGHLHVRRRQERRDVLRLQEPRHRLGRAEVRHQQGTGRQAARDDRADADADGPGRGLRGLLRRDTRSTRRSPARPTAPSRCRTSPTPSRSGSRSATPTYVRSSSARRRPTRRSTRRPPRSTASPASRDEPDDDLRRAAGSGAGPPSRAGRHAGRLSPQSLGTMFVAPYVLFLAAVFAYPLGFAVYMSFHDYFFAAPGAVVERPFVGLANYAAVLSDPGVRQAFGNIGVFLVINVPLTVALALVLATALNAGIRARTFFRVSYYVPYITASVAVVGVWLFLFNSARAGQHRPRPAQPGAHLAGQPAVGDADGRGVRDMETARLLHPALSRRSAERAEGAVRGRGGRRRRSLAVVLGGHRPGRASGHHTRRDPCHGHRGKPVHRAVPAHRRWRPGRCLDIARPGDVPARDRAG